MTAQDRAEIAALLNRIAAACWHPLDATMIENYAVGVEQWPVTPPDTVLVTRAAKRQALAAIDHAAAHCCAVADAWQSTGNPNMAELCTQEEAKLRAAYDALADHVNQVGEVRG